MQASGTGEHDKKKFEDVRKQHYNMKEALRKAKEEEEAEEEEEEEGGGGVGGHK